MRRAATLPLTLLFGLLAAACTDAREGPTATAPGLSPITLRAAESAAGTTLGQPLPGLSLSQLASFNRGKTLFEKTFTQFSGLGPIFNASSCRECHGETQDVTGGTGDEIETHFTNVRSDGSCDPLTSKGGFVHQDSVTPLLHNATGLNSEPFPTVTHQRGMRSTPDLFGFGLIAAIPNQAIIDQQDPYDSNYDGVSGRAHYTPDNDIGKFGRKAQEGSVTAFNAGALLQEMGITNSRNPAENNIGGMAIPPGVDPTPEPEMNDTDFNDLNNFVIFLAPPPAKALTTNATYGRDIFNSIGCKTCHTPQYTTTDVGIAVLSYKTVRPFSDFLLHDMGSTLGDICLNDARQREFRTEPLMGARFLEVFMHDGRATTIDQAIQLHGGEGANARTRYNNLTSTQKGQLIEYVNSL